VTKANITASKNKQKLGNVCIICAHTKNPAE